MPLCSPAVEFDPMGIDWGTIEPGEMLAVRIRSRKKRLAPPIPLRVRNGRIIHALEVVSEEFVLIPVAQRGRAAA